MIVVDASLATKLIFREDGSDAALAFVENHQGELCGPDLLLSEVCAAIVRRANEDKRSAPFATEAIERWAEGWDTVFVAHRLTADPVARAGTLAIAIGHPLADCIYLALAMDLECDLATCDVRFRDRAIALYPSVRLLSDYVDRPNPGAGR